MACRRSDPGRGGAGAAARAKRCEIMESLVDESARAASASNGRACRIEERLSGSQAPALYAISLAVVFLCLAALYESWSIPVTVLLVGAARRAGRGAGNARARHVQRRVLPGRPADDDRPCREERSADRGVREGELRSRAASRGSGDATPPSSALRPIVMTSLAFMFGVLPLALASGAGSGAQNAVGTGRHRRHARVDVPRDAVRAGVLRRDPAELQGEADQSACRAVHVRGGDMKARAARDLPCRRRRAPARWRRATSGRPRRSRIPTTLASRTASRRPRRRTSLWRDVFPDPQLQDLIGRALANNRDLRVAALNVEAARAQYRIQRSALVPSIDAEGSGSSQRVPADLSFTGESELTPAVQRRSWRHRLRAGFVRPPAQPASQRAGAVFRFRGSAHEHAARARRRSRERMADADRR